MGHGLQERGGKMRMFWGEGKTPWHGLGTGIEGLATTDEALDLAGLGYEVVLMPNYYHMPDGTAVRIPDRFSTVRMEDGKVLGSDLSTGYHVYQNRDAFQFLNAITDTGSGDAVFSTAGELFGGSRTFITLKLNDTFTVADNDAHQLYMMCTNSHDGKQAFNISITAIRAVCWNTVTLGLREAKTSWTLRHKVKLEDRVQDAREALQLAFKYEDAFEKEVQKLMEISVTDQQFYKIVDKIIPASKEQHDIDVDILMDIWKTEPTVEAGGGKGNGWGAFNAMTYFTDNTKKYRTDESRFKSIIGTGVGQGFAERLRPAMHKQLLAL